MTNTTDLATAAADRPYFFVTCDDKVTYRAAFEARTFTAAAHMWLPEFVVEIEDRIVGRRKTAKGALALLVKLADADYISRR